jgi:hypothetical protein
MEIKKKSDKEKEVPVQDFTTCEATQQMITKGRLEGVETAFDRAANMKACPIGADSACCKHCFMGPCRLNARDPYGKVGICGATIDTIMARNFARMIAAGGAAHTDHGMSMLDLFREVVNGNIKDYSIKDTQKLEAVAKSIGIETEGRTVKEVAVDLVQSAGEHLHRGGRRNPLCETGAAQNAGDLAQTRCGAPRRDAGNHGDHAPQPHGRGSGLRQHHQAVQPHRAGRRLGRFHGGHGDFRYPFRHPVTGEHRGEHGRAQGGPGQYHYPRPRAQPVRIDDRIGQ